MQEEQLNSVTPQPVNPEENASDVAQNSSNPPQEIPVVSAPKRGGGKKLLAFFIFLVMLSVVAVGFGVVSGRRAQEVRKDQQQQQEQEVATTGEEADALTTQYESVSTSDEIDDIEADITDTTFVGIDNELTLIDQELANEE